MTPAKKNGLDYDVMIVGAGVAGMETAALLGDMGYKVLLVEKEPSIGGKSILLSKVFPTLDCASCIVTPKMAAVAHHPQITPMVYTEVDGFVRNDDGSFNVDLHKKASYVNFDACTGCAKCEQVCTVALPDEYNYDLAARRAAHIPFPQAVPKKAVISRQGQAPCNYACPAGVKPSGFVSLVRAGRFDEAFKMHLEDTPLVGSLARACYAPCESECTRGDKDGTLHIRAIKRFMADHYYANHPEPEYGPPQELVDKRVAVVGSGPGGLNLAYHLARKGYQVKIFEAEPEPDGQLRFGIPAYRLPKSVLDRDIKNVTALGVEIETGVRINSLKGLKERGFDAVGLVFQNPDDQLFSPTVYEDVAFGPLYQGLGPEEVAACVTSALAAVWMQAYTRHISHHLSTGEKKRIAIATVLSMKPEVLVLDEPTAGLDPRARRGLINLLRELPVTMLAASHDLHMVSELFPRMVVMDEGRIVADGPTGKLMEDKKLLEAHGLEKP